MYKWLGDAVIPMSVGQIGSQWDISHGMLPELAFYFDIVKDSLVPQIRNREELEEGWQGRHKNCLSNERVKAYLGSIIRTMI